MGNRLADHETLVSADHALPAARPVHAPAAASQNGSSTSSDDTCVRAEYARNTTAYLIAFPYQTTEYAGACGTGTILSQSRTYYDNTLTLGAAPARGLKTKNESLTTAPDTWANGDVARGGEGRRADYIGGMTRAGEYIR